MKTSCSLDIIFLLFSQTAGKNLFFFLRKGNGDKMICHEQVAHKKMLVLRYRHDVKHAPFHC